jgi:hypothetical protein
MKVETHNHPTAISPFPGAATGSGGEIRDEGATGRGGKPKAGLTASRSPTCACRVAAPWEEDHGRRPHRVRPPDHARGPARRGRLQQRVRPSQPVRLLPHLSSNGARRRGPEVRGYHKPIMLAGGSATSARSTWRSSRFPGRQGDRAGRAGHAHRPGRRRRVEPGLRRQRGGPRLRLGAARQPRDAAPLPGGHRPLLPPGRGQPHPVDSRRRRRRPVQRRARTGERQRVAAAASSYVPCPTTIPACRPWRSGATRPRSATCWR